MYKGSSSKDKFIQLCLQGEVLPDEIDDFIEKWHQSDSSEELHEFLGMTWNEYAAWVADKSILSLIIASHKTSKPLHDPMQNPVRDDP